MSALYIIRHGKTEMNRANLLQGRSDIPLNEEGILQAQEASDSLRDVHFNHVFSSPLSRALQTARIVAPQADPTVDERLIEMDYGQYEGTDLTQLPPELVFFFSDFVHNPEGAFRVSDARFKRQLLVQVHRQLRCIYRGKQGRTIYSSP